MLDMAFPLAMVRVSPEDTLMHRYRSHTCGALRPSDIGQTTRLSGWCHRIRDHGGVLFIDLRDHYGITQCVADPDSPAFSAANEVRSEWVVRIDGRVRERPAGTANGDLPTGDVEIYITDLEVLGPAAELPVPVFGDQEYPEELRLRYRFLDLRRDKLHRNIMRRGEIIDSIRRRMKEGGFFEFQTPILTASSPEGARDFLVPSRMHPGKFYALPQAPQQFKQLIQVAGFDRYFQIAPCFRDEDARADRSPGEFYQLDVEMSFVTQEDVFGAIEPVLRDVFEEFADGKRVTGEFPRIAYADAMLSYGVDKPDLRNPLRIVDVTDAFAREEVTFNAFKNVIKAGGVVRAIPAPGAASEPRSFFDKLNEWARGEGAAGLGYVVFGDEDGRLQGKGPIAKFIPDDVLAAIAMRAGVGAGDAVFFAAGRGGKAAALAGKARVRIGDELICRQGPVRLLLDYRFPDVRVVGGGETDRLLPQSRSPCRTSSTRPFSPSTRPTVTRSSASRPSSTTSCATASSCRPAPSATIGRTSCARPSARRLRRGGPGGEVRRHAAGATYGAPPHGASRPASTGSSCCSAASRICARSCSSP
jgi:aspartyl-tRNA synthetase